MSNKNKDRRDLVRAVRNVLRRRGLQNGDVILVKDQSLVHRNMNAIAEALGQTGHGDCIMIAVGDFDDLTVFDEAGMNAHGWFRKDIEDEEAART